MLVIIGLAPVNTAFAKFLFLPWGGRGRKFKYCRSDQIKQAIPELRFRDFFQFARLWTSGVGNLLLQSAYFRIALPENVRCIKINNHEL